MRTTEHIYTKKGGVISVIVLCFLFGMHVHAQTFSRNLQLGDRGEDVRQLQKTLNQDIDTQVSFSGSGAPGQETDYFGPLTQNAVIRYQEKNRESILSPFALTRGTGFVGEATRVVLNANRTPKTDSVSQGVPEKTRTEQIQDILIRMDRHTVVASQSQITIQDGNLFLDPITQEKIQNTNRENVDELVSKVREFNTGKVPEEVLNQIEQTIRSDVANAHIGDPLPQTLLQTKPRTFEEIREDVEDFENIMLGKAPEKKAKKLLVNNIVEPFKRILTAFDPRPRIAQAQYLQPFGGKVTGVYLCSCSANFLVFVTPATTLFGSYEPGTQGYLSYTFPYVDDATGLYAPVSAPMCWVPVGTGCAGISAQGIITYITGSDYGA